MGHCLIVLKTEDRFLWRGPCITALCDEESWCWFDLKLVNCLFLLARYEDYTLLLLLVQFSWIVDTEILMLCSITFLSSQQPMNTCKMDVNTQHKVTCTAFSKALYIYEYTCNCRQLPHLPNVTHPMGINIYVIYIYNVEIKRYLGRVSGCILKGFLNPFSCWVLWVLKVTFAVLHISEQHIRCVLFWKQIY